MAKEYDISELQSLIEERNVEKIKEFMKNNDLIVKDGRICPRDKSWYDFKANLFNLKQYVKKIFLNSSYGALLNSSSTFYDFRLGASTTLSGRLVWRNLSAEANNQLCGKYEENGVCQAYGDTDSKISTTNQRVMIDDDEFQMTVESLFNHCDSFFTDERTGKEYGFTDMKVLGYNSEEDKPEYYNINYVYRHKTSKPKWEIEDENGNIITVTGDHSCMVERDGVLITVKPIEILDSDILITIEDK